MKSLIKDDHADVKMIGAVVGILITLIIAILVFYSVSSSVGSNLTDLDTDSAANTNMGADAQANTTYVTNATNDILDQSATFFQIAPIIAIVVVAVVILGYVGKIGG